MPTSGFPLKVYYLFTDSESESTSGSSASEKHSSSVVKKKERPSSETEKEAEEEEEEDDEDADGDTPRRLITRSSTVKTKRSSLLGLNKGTDSESETGMCIIISHKCI